MKTTIKTLLGSIKEKQNTSAGICGQPAMVSLRLGAFAIVRDLMVQWPKYSGSYDYPVPSTIEGRTPCQCFHDNIHNMWDRNTEYGALRWELLEWLLEQPELDVQLYRMQLAGGTIFNIKD